MKTKCTQGGYPNNALTKGSGGGRLINALHSLECVRGPTPPPPKWIIRVGDGVYTRKSEQNGHTRNGTPTMEERNAEKQNG